MILRPSFGPKTGEASSPTLLLSVIVLLCTALFAAPVVLKAQAAEKPSAKDTAQKLPHYREIMEIIRPLTYSGFYMIQKPGVDLSIDFKNRTWTLHDMRQYAPDGTLLLDEGRNGLCAELTYHTFQKLKPLLRKPWEIKFARASEPNFFPDGNSTHVVLILGNPATQATYLLDPSFHRYGTTTELPQYTILGAKDELRSFQKKDANITMAVNDSFPLVIRHNELILLSVESVSDTLDKENLLLSISARKRHKDSSRYLMALRREKGRVKWLQQEDSMKRLFTAQEAEAIRKKFVAWTENL